jgi:hypothetical protein
MNPYVRDRINRKLDTLSDERLYQVLDYVEFLESRYAEKAAAPVNLLTRFAEGVEDQLRAGGVAASTVAETMELLGKAMGVLGGVAETAVSVATGVVNAARTAVDQVGAPPPGGVAAPAGNVAPGAAPNGGAPPASAP